MRNNFEFLHLGATKNSNKQNDYLALHCYTVACHLSSWSLLSLQSTVGQNNQEYRLEYWTTRPSVRSFARTAYLFACSALLAGLTRAAALTPSLARSFCSLPRSWESKWLDGYLFCVFFSKLAHSAVTGMVFSIKIWFSESSRQWDKTVLILPFARLSLRPCHRG